MTKLVRLGDVVDYIRGITFKPDDLVETNAPAAVVCMRTKNIQTELDESDRIAVPPAFVKRSEQYLIEGDVLISSANSWNLVGKVVAVPKLRYPATAGGFISIVRAKKSYLDARYLFNWLQTDSVQSQIRNCGRQTTNISNLSSQLFLELKIPLHPLAEQHRIATILDMADSLRRKRQEAIRLADDFLRAAFYEMFGDPVANNRRWPERAIDEIAKVTTGNTPSREVDAYFGNAIEWIKSDNINTPSHWLTRAREGLSKLGLTVARTAPTGSTLMTCIAGSPSCIGNVAMTDRTVSFNQQINAVTPISGVQSEFVYALLLFSKGRIQATSTNSMKGMVSKGALEKVHLIWPPSDLQEKFVKLFRQVHQVRTRMVNADVSQLSNALQSKLLA